MLRNLQVDSPESVLLSYRDPIFIECSHLEALSKSRADCEVSDAVTSPSEMDGEVDLDV